MPSVPLVVSSQRPYSQSWRIVPRWIVRAWRRFQVHASRERTAALLSDLDERTLQDLGISRDEIRSLAHGTDWGRQPRSGARAASSPPPQSAAPSASVPAICASSPRPAESSATMPAICARMFDRRS